MLWGKTHNVQAAPFQAITEFVLRTFGSDGLNRTNDLRDYEDNKFDPKSRKSTQICQKFTNPFPVIFGLFSVV
jgi:hypothetical protein